MNRIDNFICNRVLGAWQAASELATVRRSRWGRRHKAGAVVAAAARLWNRGCVLVGGAAIVLALSASPLLAAPLTHATGGDGSPTSGGGDGGGAGQAGKDGSSGTGGSPGTSGAPGTPGTGGGNGAGTGGGGGGGDGGTLTHSPTGDMQGGDGGYGDYVGGGGGGDGALITQAVSLSIDSDITLQGGNGGNSPGSSGGGGGGAGLYISGQNTAAELAVSGNIRGGSGGATYSGIGGGGGGAGVVVADGAQLDLDLSGHIEGGAGGSGAVEGASGDGMVAGVNSDATVVLTSGAEIAGGAGQEMGDGGAGLRLLGGGRVINNGGTIRGGDVDGWHDNNSGMAVGGSGSGGAAGGRGGNQSSEAGVGIVGQSVIIRNAGTIAGGNHPSDGRANAITFTGGNNELWLLEGSVINGVVDATASDVARLMLGGSVVDSSFDPGQIGPTAQYRGFDQFWAVGNGVVTLTGTTTEVTPWTADSETTLSIATDASLGGVSGDLLLRYGGTLEVTGTANDTTARNIGIYHQGHIDIADANNNFTLNGAISNYDPPGSAGPQASALIKQGAGTLTLVGTNTYTGGTRVEGGTLVIAAGSSAGPVADINNPQSGVILLNGGTTLRNAGAIGEIELDNSSGPNTQPVTVINTESGSIAGTVALFNGSLTNSGSVSIATADGPFGGGVMLYGEGSVDNTGSINAPQTTGALLGVPTSSSTPITGSIQLTNHAGGSIEGSLGVLVNQMVTLATTGSPTSSRPISIINDGGTISGSQMGIELIGGGTIINRAGSTIKTTATTTGPCTVFFPGSGSADGSCAIFAPDVADLSSLPDGTVLPPTMLTNAGSIVGNVQLSDGLANDVTLVAGGSIDGDLDIGTSSDALLTLKGGAGTTQTWSQAVTGTTTFAGTLTKSGAGTWMLDNAALAGVTGTTQLQGGSLIVGGTGADGGALGGNVAVAADATLGGHGAIAGNVTVANSGHIAPGNSVGTLTMNGHLLLNSGSILDYELGSPGSAADLAFGISDRIDVGGDLTLDGTINLAQGTDNADGTAGLGYYRLLTYGGNLTDNGLDVGTTPTISGVDKYEIQAGGGNVDLFIAATGDGTLQHWQGGDGTWNATKKKWLNQGGTAPAIWAGNHAAFKNQPGGFNGGTITVDGTQSFKGLQFVDEGYRLQGTGTLQVDGTDRADGNAEIRVLADVTARIATTIAGSGGISKTQGGTLVLEGDNSYQGGTAINGGTLSVSSDANLGDAGGGLSFDGGTFQNTAAFTTARNMVLHAGGGILQTDADLTASGSLSGDGNLTKTGAGTLTLTGNNNDVGGFTIHDGTLAVDGGTFDQTPYVSGNRLYIGRAVGDDATFVVTNGGAASTADAILVSESVDSQGHIRISGSGTTLDAWSLGIGRYGTGTLSVTHGGQLSSSYLYVGGSDGPGTGHFVISDTGSRAEVSTLYVGYADGSTGEITVSGGSALAVKGQADIGTQNITGSAGINIGASAADPAAAPGRFSASEVRFYHNRAHLNFNHTGTNYRFDSPLVSMATGVGAVNHYAGNTTLTGDSSGFSGTTTLYGGALSVNGTLGGAIVVKDGATLGGSGTVGTTTVADGGHVAPGNSIGTLHVGGDYSAAAGSTYVVEVNAAGDHDLTAVKGKAQLQGGDVQVLAANGNYAPRTDYGILTADGGVNGTFDSVSSNLSFLNPLLSYDSNDVILTLLRNSNSFASKAKTPNQHKVAEAIEDTGPGDPRYDSVVKLTTPGAQQAFDALSGEYYANRQSALLHDSIHLRQAVSQRLGRDCVRAPANTMTATRTRLCAGTVWLRAYGDWGRFDGDGNATDIDFNSAGVFIGADKHLTPNVRLGFLFGAGHGDSDSDSNRDSHGSNDNVQLGLYAGYVNGPVNLKAGVAHSWYSLDSERDIRYPGFSDHTSADSDATSTQVFVESGYTFDLETTGVTPFVRAAYIHLHSDGFGEDGGAAALHADSNNHDIGTSLAGVRINRALWSGDSSAIRLRGMIGWQHRFGDMTPEATLRFDGSQRFTVEGTPMARDALALRAGIGASVNNNLTLGVSYVGQYGSDADSNGVRASLEWEF